MALPSNVTFGTVVGTFLTATADTPDDPDRDPQGIAATDLKFRFTPDLAVPVARDATATPPVMFALQDILATVGTDGSLLGPDGAPGVKLVASTNSALQPNGWTWKVVLSGSGFPAMSFSFLLDPAATIDLSTVLQVPANPGGTLNAWLQAVADASAARDAAIAAAATVPSAASLSATYVPLLAVLATVTTAAAPSAGKIQQYNAAGGVLAPVLPALSGLTAGSTYLGAQKALADTSTNYLTVTTTTGDTFDSGSTSLTIRGSGELRILQVVSIGGTKYWKVVGGNTPLSYFDGTYSPLPAVGTTPGFLATVASDGRSLTYAAPPTGGYDGGSF